MAERASSSNAEICCQELVTYYLDYIDKITLLPGDFYHSVHISRIYTSLELLNEGNAAARNQQTLQNHSDLLALKTAHGRQIKRIMIRGDPGTGKTTAMKKLTYDWADTRDRMLKGEQVEANNPYQHYELLFFLRLGELEDNFDLVDTIFDQLLPADTEVDKSCLNDYIKRNGEKVCVILDGVDELSRERVQDESSGNIIQMLHGKALRKCFVLATSRPWNLQDLGRSRPLYTHAQMTGFSDENIDVYVKRYFEGSGKERRARELLDNLQSSAAKKELARNPMVLLMMCLLWENKKDVPETITRLYEKAMIYMADRLAIDKSNDEPGCDEDITEAQLEQLTRILGPVALTGLLDSNGKVAFRDADFSQESRSFVLGDACEIGIITKDLIKSGLKMYYRISFLHKTFQEFLAARYWKSLVDSVEDFQSYLSMIKTLDDAKALEFLLLFCCGDHRLCAERILKHLLLLPYSNEEKTTSASLAQQERRSDDSSCDESDSSMADHVNETKRLILRCYQEAQSGHLCSIHLQDIFFSDQRLTYESPSHKLNKGEFLDGVAYLLGIYCQCPSGCKLHIRQVLLNIILTSYTAKQTIQILQHLKQLESVEVVSLKLNTDAKTKPFQKGIDEFLGALSKLDDVRDVKVVIHNTSVETSATRCSIDAIINSLRHLPVLQSMSITGVSCREDKTNSLHKVARGHPSLLNLRLNQFLFIRETSQDNFTIYEEEEQKQYSHVSPIPSENSRDSAVNEAFMETQETRDALNSGGEANKGSTPQYDDVIPDFAGFYTNHRMQRATPAAEQLDISRCYDMGGRDKGLALVINIYKFEGEGTPERKGSDVDHANIKHLCTEIGYEVEEHENLTAQEILNVIRTFVGRCNQVGIVFKSSFVVLMSHGNKGFILGTDNHKVTMEDIQTMFDADNCPGLVNKPKLFFIQACRGKKRSVSSGSTGSGNECIDVTADAPPNMPPIDDMHFAYACPEGYLSLRSETDGSWFVQALCEVFLARAHIDNLPELMVKVTERVTRETGRLQDHDVLVKQTPECVTRLRKTLYFLPGYPPPQ